MNKQRRSRIAEALELISEAREILEEVRDEEQESYDNLPEGLQAAERGEQMQKNVEDLYIIYRLFGRNGLFRGNVGGSHRKRNKSIVKWA